MDKTTTGTVISASKQWWLKINTKPIRMHALDGAVFPYIIKVRYTVNGREYKKAKWISAGKPVPDIGSTVSVFYCESKPSKAKVLSGFIPACPAQSPSFTGDHHMSFQGAQKLRDVLLLIGFVLMLSAYLYAPLLIIGAVTALFCVIPDYLYNKCPHCGKHLGRNTKKFCQHCGRSIK